MPAMTSLSGVLSLSFTKRLLLGALLANLLVAALGGWFLRQSYVQHQQRAAVSTQNLAKVLGEEVGSDIGQVNAALLAVADEAEKHGIRVKDIDAFLARQLSRHPELHCLSVTDAGGALRHGGAAQCAGRESIPDPAQFSRHRDNPSAGLVVGRPVLLPQGQAWVLPISRRLAHGDGSFAGVVFGTIALEHITKTFSRLDVGQEGEVNLGDPELRLIASHPEPRDMTGAIARPSLAAPLLERIRAGEEAATRTFRAAPDGIERTYSYRKVAGYPLYVTIGLSTREYLAEWRHESFNTLVLLVFFVAVTLLSAVLISRAWRHQASALSQLENSQEQLRLSARVFEKSSECIMITDAEERILSVNHAFHEVTGFSAEEVIGQTPRMMRSGFQSVGFYSTMWHTLEHAGHWEGEIWDRSKDGRFFLCWLSITAVRDAENRVVNYIGIFSDITERKEVEKQVRFLAYHDALTELPNRMLAMDHWELAMAHADRVRAKAVMMFLDLDDFKTINDSLGHRGGDEFLKAVAKRLRGCVRDIDTISRQGGDEFLILYTDVRNLTVIDNIVDKILARMAEPFNIEGHEISTSVSLGVAVYPDDGDNFDTALRKADTAMYHAKEAGRNAYRFYSEEMNVNAIKNLALRNSLRKAVEREELVLHYQPQVDVKSGATIGVEALLRWRHPDVGLLTPGDFISIAEESGLIVPIGEWVLREACRQAVAWLDAGLPALTMAVNLSAVQFKRGDLEQVVSDVLARSGLDPALLELELTESILIQETEKALVTVDRLKALGVKLSIDDFGTGYSSLSYLKRFAVDKLKIDRSFIRHMVDSPNDAAIVRAIVQMAKSLNLKTIAEGVEDAEVLEMLRALDCDEVQGFHFSPALPADECFRHIRAR